MRLDSIILKDFQAHAKQVIKFAPGITTIVGATDVGKSAVLRALRWVCLNDTAGTEFVREGAKKTEVVLSVDVGEGKKGIILEEITRTKSRNGALNTYELDGREYKSFGQAVPADIAGSLQLNEINFQGQHDSPFWFNETAGEVSRRLNSVIDLSVIDTTLTNIGSEVRRCQERKGVCEERLKEINEQLKELEPQRVRVDEFLFLKEKKAKLDESANDCDRLDGLMGRIRSNPVRDLEAKAASAEAALLALRSVLTATRQQENLASIIDDINRHQSATQPPPPLQPVTEAFEVWLAVDGQCVHLGDLIDDLSSVESGIQRKAGSVKNAETDFINQTKGKNCPVCQRLLR